MSRVAPEPTKVIDWPNLGFTNHTVAGQVVVTWREGKWGEPKWSTDPFLKVHAAATALNYGQQCFEGIKVSVVLLQPVERCEAVPQQELVV